MICRSYGAYGNLGAHNYKDFAPTEHYPDLPNVQLQGPGLKARAIISDRFAVWELEFGATSLG
jgi:hypothetical protein